MLKSPGPCSMGGIHHASPSSLSGTHLTRESQHYHLVTIQTTPGDTTAICSAALLRLTLWKTATACPCWRDATVPTPSRPSPGNPHAKVALQSRPSSGTAAGSAPVISDAHWGHCSASLQSRSLAPAAQPPWHRSQRGLVDVRAVRHDLRLPSKELGLQRHLGCIPDLLFFTDPQRKFSALR